MTQDWIEVAIEAEAEAVEAVAEQLRALGHPVSIEYPITQPSPYEDATLDLSRPAVVKTFLPDSPSVQTSCRQIEEALWPLGQLSPLGPLRTRRILEEDWANAWKAFFPVLPVGQRIVIVPRWRRHRRQPGEVVVRLDPGMAFGTGTHPTTRLCLEAMEPLITPSTRVLDVGTGSGILAIVAARLGAAQVRALDIDPVAVAAAQANVRLNRLSRQVRVAQGSADQLPARWAQESFDLVLANLTARVNARLAGPLVRVAAPGGRVVVSGVLAADLPWVEGAFARLGLSAERRLQDGDWTAAVLRRA